MQDQLSVFEMSASFQNKTGSTWKYDKPHVVNNTSPDKPHGYLYANGQYEHIASHYVMLTEHTVIFNHREVGWG